MCTIHAALLAWPALKNSPVNDELAHLPAGIVAWRYGRFDLYRVNPPLVKMLAAAPVVLQGPVTDWSSYATQPKARRAWGIGQDLFAANENRAFWYLTLARWVVIPLSLLGLVVCYRWANELYGRKAGLLAAALWCFSPNILAGAALITPDAGAAAVGVTAGYCFWRWLKKPDWTTALWAGIAFGLAQLTKMTWVILFGLWPVLWLLWILSASGREPAAQARDWGALLALRARARGVGQLAAILLLGVYLLNAGYGFDGSFKRLGDFPFVSRSLAGPCYLWPERQEWGNRFAGTWVGEIPVPVPENYLRGIDVQKRDFEQAHVQYLHGSRRSGGFWYFYLYGLLVKVPLGTWVLALLATVATPLFWKDRVCSNLASPRWRDTLVLLAPPVAVLMLVSLNTSVSHFRYLLPAFPFAFVAISRVGRVFDGASRVAKGLTGLALATSIASSLWVWPHSLSYFNRAAGGPMNGHAHMIGSAMDWGQDLFYLKDWLDEHPEVESLKLAYYGRVDPRLAGIEFTLPPVGVTKESAMSRENTAGLGPQPGWYAVSVQVSRDPSRPVMSPEGGQHSPALNGYQYFLHYQPVATAGYSIYIYHITLDEANRVRREMGLAKFPARR